MRFLEYDDRLLLYGYHALINGGYVWGSLELLDVDKPMKFNTVTNLMFLLSELPTFQTLTFEGPDPMNWGSLERLLSWHQSSGMGFNIRVRTPLELPPERPEVWVRCVKEVALDLDAVTRANYEKVYGRKGCGDIVFANLNLMAHPNVTIRSRIRKYTLSEVDKILTAVTQIAKSNVKRVVFEPVDIEKDDEEFWGKWDLLIKLGEKHNRKEKHPKVRFVNERDIRQCAYGTLSIFKFCHMGAVYFYAKANGDIYPCDRVTDLEEYCIGNILKTEPLALSKSFRPTARYAEYGTCCKERCGERHQVLNTCCEMAKKQTIIFP